jgi:hypothetical protein
MIKSAINWGITGHLSHVVSTKSYFLSLSCADMPINNDNPDQGGIAGM